MQEVFEKIIEKLEELQNYACFPTEWVNAEQSKIHSYYANKLTEILKLTEQYNNGWIPCSEWLPKYGEVVMCSCTNGGITISCITHMGEKTSKIVRFGQHSVIAWQPLPEPYQPKGE